MNEDKRLEEKMERTLQAITHTEEFSEEELRMLSTDEECLQVCRDLLEAKEALARKNAPNPNVEEEWSKFSACHSASQASIQQEGDPQYSSVDTLMRKRRTRIIRLGITLLAAASIALFFLLHASAPVGYTVFEATAEAQEITVDTQKGINVLTVPRGMNKKITLSDDTQVWLNAETRLEYPESFEGQERRVVRLKGEAYFEVAKDAEHPFIVETDLLETQVLGTSFNVRAYSPEDAHVTLMEGSVKVRNADHKNEVLIKSGENATLQHNGKLFVKQVEEATTYQSWTEGQFYFDNTELVEIMRELGRWYNINIIFTHKEAMHYRLHFQSDRNEPLPQVLDLLNSMQKVNAKIENGKVIVSL